jgi:hypothetical protein
MNIRLTLLLVACWPLGALAAASHIALPGGDELWLDIPAAWSQKFEAPDSKTPSPCLPLLK